MEPLDSDAFPLLRLFVSPIPGLELEAHDGAPEREDESAYSLIVSCLTSVTYIPGRSREQKWIVTASTLDWRMVRCCPSVR
jgi:hypothetical protein